MTKRIDQHEVFSGEFLWTVDRYEQAIESGIFTEDDHLELVYGKFKIRDPGVAVDHRRIAYSPKKSSGLSTKTP